MSSVGSYENLPITMANFVPPIKQLIHYLIRQQMEMDMLQEANQVLQTRDDYTILLNRYGITCRTLEIAERVVPAQVARVVNLRTGPGSGYYADGRVLYTQSVYFARELIRRPHEFDDLVTIHLPELDTQAVQSVMKCLYSGNLCIYPRTPDQITLVMQAATTFELSDITTQCLALYTHVTRHVHSSLGFAAYLFPFSTQSGQSPMQLLENAAGSSFSHSLGLGMEAVVRNSIAAATAAAAAAAASSGNQEGNGGTSGSGSGSASASSPSGSGGNTHKRKMDDIIKEAGSKDWNGFENKRRRYDDDNDGNGKGNGDGDGGMDMS